MTDREFLIWIHERLEHVHKERELFDYMHKLRAIIHSTPKHQETPNDGRGENGLKELLATKRFQVKKKIRAGERG